jgi:hypothetical protein
MPVDHAWLHASCPARPGVFYSSPCSQISSSPRSYSRSSLRTGYFPVIPSGSKTTPTSSQRDRCSVVSRGFSGVGGGSLGFGTPLSVKPRQRRSASISWFRGKYSGQAFVSPDREVPSYNRPNCRGRGINIFQQKWPNYLVIVRHGESERNVLKEAAKLSGHLCEDAATGWNSNALLHLIALNQNFIPE